MTSFVKYCRKCKYTNLLPEDLTIPRGAYFMEKKILQPEDIRKLFSCDETVFRNKRIKEPFINGYRFEVLTGLRPGEILGLKWSDIFRDKVFLQRSINAYGEETTGKNDNAGRNFELNDISRAVIEAQREYQRENNISSEWVFTDTYGDPLRQKIYCAHWKKYCTANDITETTTYELRHTFVSAVKSLPEGYLKAIVGHSKDMDTYGVYSHEFSDDSTEAAKLVGDIFNKILSTV